MHFIPTLGMMATAEKSYNFVKNNKKVFFEIMKPLAPYMIVFLLLDVVTIIVLQTIPFLGAILYSYFFSALAISWHRVVVYGSDSYVPMNPLKPKKNGLIFIGLWILISLISIIIFMAITAILIPILGRAFISINEFIGPFIGLLIGLFIPIYIGYRLSFCFPARATNSPITFVESFILTRSYSLKMMGSTFVASLGVIVFMIIYFFATSFIFSLILENFVALDKNQFDVIFNPILHILNFIIALPLYLYFYPLLLIYGVTVLSSYYQYALQNKAEAHKSA